MAVSWSVRRTSPRQQWLANELSDSWVNQVTIPAIHFRIALELQDASGIPATPLNWDIWATLEDG